MTYTGAKERIMETSHQKVYKVNVNEIMLKYCNSKIVNPDLHPVKTSFKNEITNRHILCEMFKNVLQVEKKFQIEMCIYKSNLKSTEININLKDCLLLKHNQFNRWSTI